jgi:hypothetical protein
MALPLTNERRDSILCNAQDLTFAARREAIKQESNRLAELAYSHLYPADVQAKMNALPVEFFSQTSTIFAYLPGNGDSVNLDLISSRRVGACDREWRRPAYYLVTGSAVTECVVKLKADRGQLAQDVNTFKSELRRFLAGITTVKKLKEVWPEGEEFYKHLLGDDAPKNALAVRPETINALIGSMKEVA